VQLARITTTKRRAGTVLGTVALLGLLVPTTFATTTATAGPMWHQSPRPRRSVRPAGRPRVRPNSTTHRGPRVVSHRSESAGGPSCGPAEH
jgi:hypothetical protein